HRASERRGQSSRLIHVVGLDVRHPVWWNALLPLLLTKSKDAPDRHAATGPHGVVLVESLRAPSGDGGIEFPRCVDVGRGELVPHELTVHGEVRSEGGDGSPMEACAV